MLNDILLIHESNFPVILLKYYLQFSMLYYEMLFSCFRLLTPPDTPLFPSLEMESRKTMMSQLGTSRAHPTALTSRVRICIFYCYIRSLLKYGIMCNWKLAYYTFVMFNTGNVVDLCNLRVFYHISSH